MSGMDFSSGATISKGKATSKRRVGFYGCAGEVVRLEDPSGEYPRVTRIDCPACGHNHTVRLAWRPYNEAIDAEKEAIELDADPS